MGLERQQGFILRACRVCTRGWARSDFPFRRVTLPAQWIHKGKLLQTVKGDPLRAVGGLV